jgi:hypothetical protein
MVKKILISTVAGLAMVALGAGTALAHDFAISKTAECQPDGSYKISWTIDNTTESSKDLTITASSDESVVPVNTVIPADHNQTFVQIADGTQPGSFTLKITGVYSDEEPQMHQRTATLRYACKQPSTITVKKTTNPAGDPTNFSVTISTEDGQVYGDATQSIKDGGSVVYKVADGTYNVTEAAVSGWSQTSNTCKDLVVSSETESDIWVNDENQTPTPTNVDCAITNTKNTTPPTGQGGGQVLAVTTQVKAPVGPVNGGAGAGSEAVNLAALLGLGSSLGAVGFGIRRLVKS